MKTNSINTFSISGHITANAEPKGANNEVIRFTVAHNYGKDQDPLYLACVMFEKERQRFGKSVPVESLVKGQAVVVKGSLRPNNYTDKDGVSHKGIDFIVSNVTFIEKDEPEQEAEEAPAPASKKSTSKKGTK